MQISCFVPYSLGMVAENKDLTSDTVEIWPIEMTPTMEGELTSDTLELETKGIDGDSKEYQASVKVGTTIPAKWLGGADSNRITPPDVRRGERVMLYTAKDSNQFYWRTHGLDQNLRRLETVIFAFSGNPDNDDQDAPTPENSYFFEVNTHEKIVTFQNSTMNGELAQFTFQVDPGEGKFKVHDEKGNHLFMDSVNTRFYLENVDKSFIDVNKKVISMFAEEFINAKTDTLNVEAVTAINIKTKATTLESEDTINITTKDTTLESSNSINIKTNTTTLESGTSIDVKTGMFTMDAGSAATIKAGTITLDGPVMGTANATFTGPVAAAAVAAGGGAAAMAGGGGVSGATAEMSGPITCGGVNASGLVAGMPVLSAGKPVLTA